MTPICTGLIEIHCNVEQILSWLHAIVVFEIEVVGVMRVRVEGRLLVVKDRLWFESFLDYNRMISAPDREPVG